MIELIQKLTIAAGLAWAAVLIVGCGPGSGFSREQARSELVSDAPLRDDLHLDLPHLTAAEWVERYEPSKCSNGYTLVLYRRKIPMIIDMNGNIVHSWPEVRVTGRARLDREGRLVVLGRDERIKEYDWNGELTWTFTPSPPEDILHHDFIRLGNGNLLVLLRSMPNRWDYLQEVTRTGEVVWEWRCIDHAAELPGYDPRAEDPSHINSVREIPENRWFEAGDERFRPGNILISARNLNTILVIDKQSGSVVWKYNDGLDFQHEAVMVPPGQDGGGLITIFNNGYNNSEAYRRSSVLAIDPADKAVVWRFATDGFYSSVAGSAVPLPNGNVLISSSEGGRTFEVDSDGRLVWQWIPPFLTMRSERYPFDHCPQLAQLDRDPPRRVAAGQVKPFIDSELFAFTIPGEHVSRKIRGDYWWILPFSDACRELWLPPAARLILSYGLDDTAGQDHDIAARFRMTIRDLDTDTAVTEMEDTVSSDSLPVWRKKRLDLSELAYKRVEMCLRIDRQFGLREARVEQAALWARPKIRSLSMRRFIEARPEPEISAIEEAQIQKQLEAIGYVH